MLTQWSCSLSYPRSIIVTNPPVYLLMNYLSQIDHQVARQWDLTCSFTMKCAERRQTLYYFIDRLSDEECMDLWQLGREGRAGVWLAVRICFRKLWSKGCSVKLLFLAGGSTLTFDRDETMTSKVHTMGYLSWGYIPAMTTKVRHKVEFTSVMFKTMPTALKFATRFTQTLAHKINTKPGRWSILKM